jgi:hypothetical protein
MTRLAHRYALRNIMRRPKRSHRHYRSGKPHVGQSGSMRPGATAGECWSGGGWNTMSSTSFNEAPALSPGKTCTSSHCQVGSPGRFNEAPALAPGKRHRGAHPRRLELHASMRPRRCHRGKRRCSTRSTNTTRRFNEAPALSPGKTRAHSRDVADSVQRASMRPRRCHRGNLNLFGHYRIVDLASMRPGAGGNKVAWRLLAVKDVASMRPGATAGEISCSRRCQHKPSRGFNEAPAL